MFLIKRSIFELKRRSGFLKLLFPVTDKGIKCLSLNDWKIRKYPFMLNDDISVIENAPAPIKVIINKGNAKRMKIEILSWTNQSNSLRTDAPRRLTPCMNHFPLLNNTIFLFSPLDFDFYFVCMVV